MPTGIYPRTKEYLQRLKKQSPFQKGHKIQYKHYPHQGFQKGHFFYPGAHLFQKGHTPWHKGKKGLSQFKHTEEWKKENGIRMKKQWQDPILRDTRIKAMIKGQLIKPNKPETFLTKFLNKILPNEYKYIGDGQFILGGKCPDFLNINGKKKLIELNGDYWHSKEKTGIEPKQHEEERINHFKQFGFDTLIIWESELNNKNLKNKILTFNKS